MNSKRRESILKGSKEVYESVDVEAFTTIIAHWAAIDKRPAMIIWKSASHCLASASRKDEGQA